MNIQISQGSAATDLKRRDQFIPASCAVHLQI